MIELKVDLRGFQKWAARAVGKQVPFATARALTHLAVAARDQVRRELPHRFTIRNTRVAKGVQAVPANKSDYPACRAVVGDRDSFMALQETGGTKRPLHAADVAVPSSAITARRTAGGKVPRAIRPKRLLDAGKAFLRQGQKGPELVLRRGGEHTDVAYFLKASTRVPPRFKFRETVREDVQRRWPDEFRRSLEDALRPPPPKK